MHIRSTAGQSESNQKWATFLVHRFAHYLFDLPSWGEIAGYVHDDDALPIYYSSKSGSDYPTQYPGSSSSFLVISPYLLTYTEREEKGKGRRTGEERPFYDKTSEDRPGLERYIPKVRDFNRRPFPREPPIGP